MNPFYFYLILILIFDIAAIISAKYYSLTQYFPYMLGAVLGFGLTGLFFCKSLLYHGVAIANIIWISFSAILVTFIGYYFFKETISLLQFIGIIFLVCGLVLINFE
ncbi:hypothetical protein A2483_02795 [Candidatus Peregrinibacteria bacterium RIFOXYC2_FULL_33_13]|nr:MAG: small multidrug resistance protein, SMR family, small multidrug resistance protein, SMR family [Candidatus Peregrinibacteria bacterium GW2011_GWC2_33_13]OGJ47214.1 MAG: hypothetical protein A2229_02220 [Candidatus Peregrinibacteria bacterium RIFOXYA2_FULL_33_7]OGJ54256.1 MAG: hypothetical protein A2483_02795 [Candidatus Peregrinibacteria bacterium RIFOXYC2_FULL_33_13]